MILTSLLCRAVLAVTLAVAAVAKASDRRATADAFRELRLPRLVVPSLAVIVPLVEVLLALGLLFRATAMPASGAAFLLLLAFTALIAWHLRAGRRPACNCFGAATSRPVDGRTVGRNVLLLGLAAAAFVLDVGGEPEGVAEVLDRLADNPEAASWLVLVLGALAVGEGVLLARPTSARTAAATARPAAGPPSLDRIEPSHAALALERFDGGRTTLADVLAPDRPTLLAFTDPHCPSCDLLYPDLRGWSDRYGEHLRVAVIASGERDEVREKLDDERYDVYLDVGDVAGRLGVAGTPSAVVVDVDRSLAGPLAAGALEIRELVGDVVDGAERSPTISEPEVGAPAPALRLPTTEGEPIDLFDLSGALTAVVFVSPDCGHSVALLPELRRLEHEAEATGLQLLFVSSGERSANRRMGLRSRVVLDDRGATADAFGIDGTPSAILVDASVRIASPVAGGGDEVVALIERATRIARMPYQASRSR